MKPRLLIDENLPAGLAEAVGGLTLHATDVGPRLTDEELWEWAKREGCVIVTKDADFFDKLALCGAPPKVVWIRTGNMCRIDLVAFLAQRWARIQTLLDQAELVEVHKDRLEALKFEL
jgi:predicted nuclease of predicted toxin-antitoxin system